MMKNYVFSILIFLLFLVVNPLKGQNSPSMGMIDDDTVIINTGCDYILIAGIDDNDPGDQSISFTVTSSSPDTVAIDSVIYNTGETFAVLYISEKGLLGTSTIDVTIDDGDGTASESFDIFVGTYNKPGVNYEVHDIVFWKEDNPFGINPVFDTVVETPVAPVNNIDWNKIPLTVSGDCVGQFCDGHDFSTTLIHGFLIPPSTGEYTFYQVHNSDDALLISMDADHGNADYILYNGNNNTVGTDLGGNEWQSDTVTLTEGNVYAFYAIQWNVHEEATTIRWEGPGISKEVIPSENLLNVYDTVKPSNPNNLEIFKKGVYEIFIRWDAASDNQILNGYCIYVDGNMVNTAPISDTSYLITGLTADTKYSIVVTAVDDMGNASFISNIITDSTFPVDATPPNIPSGVTMKDSSGLAVQLSWNHSTDDTEIRGYDVYLDGEKYNDSYIYDTTLVIEGLMPVTDYRFTVIAIDAGYNESDSSSALQIQTTKYDVGNNLGVKNGRLKVKMKPISWNHGMGLNFPSPYNNLPDDTLKMHIDELNAGALRWTFDWGLNGTCDNFVVPDHEYFMGTGCAYSIGDFMHLCNKNDAYTILTVTMQEDGGFIDNQQMYANILEYFTGPASSTWGAKRAAEGYTEELFDTSRGLIIEYGNEVWGGNAHCIPLGENYTEYAEWCRETDSIIKASPYYDSTKIFTCYSGRNPRPSYSYGLNDKLLEGDNRQVDWLALSGYIGGNFDYDPGVEPGKTELDYLKNGIEVMLDKVNGMNETKNDMLELSGEIKPIWFYEGNMTTSYYNGRFGQAIIYMDYMTTGMEEGSALPCLFHIYNGQWRMIDKAKNYKKLPLFITASFFNTYCKGDVLETKLFSNNNIKDLDGNVLNADPVSCHAYHDKGDYSIILISRDFENDYYIQLDLPDTLTYNSSATKYVFTSDHYSSYETNIDTVDINLTDSMLVKVPKYGMVLIHFDGADQNFDELPLGYYGDYVEVTGLEITCQENSHIIDEPGGRLHLTATVFPDSATVKSVHWEMIGNDIDAMLLSGLVAAPSSGTGVDTFYVKATAGNAYDTFHVVVDLRTEFIENVQNKKNIKIYPNPVTNKLNIIFDGQDKYTVEILDARGEIILSEIKVSPVSFIQTGNLDPGIYLIRIRTKMGENVMHKFIKQ